MTFQKKVFHCYPKIRNVWTKIEMKISEGDSLGSFVMWNARSADVRTCSVVACRGTVITRNIRRLRELLPSYTLIISAETKGIGNAGRTRRYSHMKHIEIPSSPLSLSSFSFGERGSRPCVLPGPGSPLSRYLASPLLNSSDILRAGKETGCPRCSLSEHAPLSSKYRAVILNSVVAAQPRCTVLRASIPIQLTEVAIVSECVRVSLGQRNYREKGIVEQFRLFEEKNSKIVSLGLSRGLRAL